MGQGADDLEPIRVDTANALAGQGRIESITEEVSYFNRAHIGRYGNGEGAEGEV